MIETALSKVADDDPNRCQGVYKQGQCHHKAMPGTNFCESHGGRRAADNNNKKMIRQYNVAKWQARIGEFASHDAVKTLRDEIGIVRLLIETILNQCQSNMDLLLYSSKLGEFISKVESLVKSCHKLESSMGLLMDQQAALQLSGEIVEIISRHVRDEEAIHAISVEIANALVRVERQLPE